MDIISNQPSPTDQLVHELFSKHHEALVIYTDLAAEGESTISAFQKLDEHGPLATVLIALLENLERARASKHRPTEATSTPARDEDQPTTSDQSGSKTKDG